MDSQKGPPADVRVQVDGLDLEGLLTIPHGALGLVAFAHGSGSSRHSTRNRYVADVLNKGGLATLLFDLLTPEEEAVDVVTRELRFDIPLLAERVVGAVDWIVQQPHLQHLNVGLFGASTGAAAALIAAAKRPEVVKAVVSRGGRPDLAGNYLSSVRCPTLLIVGGYDGPVIDMNEQARRRLNARTRLEIIPGATHLFEEPGKLEAVAELAEEWFVRYLAPPALD